VCIIMPISFGVSKGGVSKSKGSARGSRGVAASFVAAASEVEEEDERTVNVAAATRLREEGVTAAEAGNFALALQKWDGAVALKPDDASLHELRSQGYLATDSFWEAIRAAERAVALDPGFSAALLTLGRAQLNFGEFDKAVETFERLKGQNPSLAHDEAVDEDVARARQLAAEHRLREAARVEARHIASIANASGSGGVAVMGGGGPSMTHKYGKDDGA
jgi:tetratricopeptide (TPR) repeat protein